MDIYIYPQKKNSKIAQIFYLGFASKRIERPFLVLKVVLGAT
jgi:hypothetical protein